MRAPEPGLAGLCVLVVEDEAMVAMQLQDLLEDVGCMVVAVASRLDAAINRCAAGGFDVVILDVNLSGEHSFPLARALATDGTPFVITTGYGNSVLPDDLCDVVLLPKPYRLQNLKRALQRAMPKSC